MNAGKVFLVLTVGFFAIMLIGEGLTGHVISQSCCTGDNCSAEYQCDFSQSSPPASPWLPLAGGALLLGALVVHHQTHHSTIKRH